MMNDDKRRALVHEALTRHIASHRLRSTPERFVVLDRMLDLPSHFTIDQLCESVVNGDFRVSRATVYNSVRLFAEAGIVQKSVLMADTWEFTGEQRQSHRVTLLCGKCGKVRDVRDVQLLRTLSLKRYPSFNIDNIEVCVRGLCNRCKTSAKPKGAPAASSRKNKK